MESTLGYFPQSLLETEMCTDHGPACMQERITFIFLHRVVLSKEGRARGASEPGEKICAAGSRNIQ